MAEQETQKHDAIVEALKGRFGAAVLGEDRSFGDLVVIVDKASSKEVLQSLRDQHGFNQLLDIAGVDCTELEGAGERFELEYMLYAFKDDVRMRVRVPVPESDLNVPTVSDLWRSANWAEREAYEMFGFKFEGHPNLKRLLTHHEFKGHPLRKDYPIMKGQWCSTTQELDEDLDE